jgi:hypothetical protein
MYVDATYAMIQRLYQLLSWLEYEYEYEYYKTSFNETCSLIIARNLIELGWKLKDFDIHFLPRTTA